MIASLLALVLFQPTADAGQDIAVEGAPLAIRLPRDWQVRSRPRSQLLLEAAGRIGSASVELTLLSLERATCLAEAEQQLEWFFRVVFEMRYRMVSRRFLEQQSFPVARLDYELSGGDRRYHMIVALFSFGRGGAALQLRVDPEAREAVHQDIDELLASVRITAPPLSRSWSEEDVRERLRQVFPDRDPDQLHVVRTAHYLVLSQAPSAERLGDRLEGHYVRFRELLPFAERATDRLLPVYLFADERGYDEFVSHLPSMPAGPPGGKSLGHAGRDYYATGASDPDSPVHAHEAAHQLATVRLAMVGGGSWLHEGIATYFAALENLPELTASARQMMARREALPWRKLMAIETLRARSAYTQAASMIAFFHAGDADWPFLELMERLGTVSINDVDATAQVLLDVTGQTLDELEQDWAHFVTDD